LGHVIEVGFPHCSHLRCILAGMITVIDGGRGGFDIINDRFAILPFRRALGVDNRRVAMNYIATEDLAAICMVRAAAASVSFRCRCV
jgi:hypothetical protein